MDAHGSRSTRVTRDELYELVWQTPMSRLAQEFGVTGNGLAKACDRLDVPYPPRGYWAKKAAGKTVVKYKLPARRDDTPVDTIVHRTQAKPTPLPEAVQSASEAAALVAELIIPEGLDRLHPRVKAWITEHKQEQRERELEYKRRRRDEFWFRSLLPDLTERDLYRFRVTSAIFEGVEKAGGKIDHSPITGKVAFLIDGFKVECSIVEKLVKSFKPRDEQHEWTAYPHHHQGGLTSSGFLRVTITTHLGQGPHQWIETDKTGMAELLPDIIGGIMAAGPVLAERKREQDEWQRKRREEEERRYELRRLKEIDDKQWARFREYADNWHEHARLTRFLVELETRLASEENVDIGDRSLSQWIEWARERITALDPFGAGATGMFNTISSTGKWP